MQAARQSVSWIVFATGLALGGGVVFFLCERARVQNDASAPPRRWEATVYLPVNDNGKQPIPKSQWEQAVALFVKEFGGATLGAEVEGCWHNGEGQLQCEPIRPLVVSFEQGRIEDFRRVLQEAGRLLGQEAMYARFDETRVLLLPIKGKSSGKDP